MTDGRSFANRRVRRLLLLAALIAAVALAGVPQLAAPAAAAGPGFQRPKDGVFHLRGKGVGHGRGLSQYGAQARAQAGQTYRQILRAYYPGTRLVKVHERIVRVRLLAAGGTRLRVHAEPGLSAWWHTPSGTVRHRTLPARLAGCPVGLWRAHMHGARLSVDARACGSWHTVVPARGIAAGGRVSFLATDGLIGLADHNRRLGYRGYLRAQVVDGRVQVVNVVDIDAYLRSVVPAEMPASWRPAALAAQAVAARTYARYATVHNAQAGYDLVDSSASQVYAGALRYDAHWQVAGWNEYASSDAAVRRTRHRVLTWHARVALTEFSSSNGGYTASGGVPYLRAGRDDFDPAFGWTGSVRARRLQDAYPSIGRLQGLVLSRYADSGSWGGRVDAVTLIGTRGRQTVTGEDPVRFLLGVPSTDLTVATSG